MFEVHWQKIIVRFTECTKILLCILIRNDSKQPPLFSSSCSELSNIVLLSMVLSPMSLNFFPLMCHKKTVRKSVSDFKVYTRSSIKYTMEQRWLNFVFHLTRFSTAGSLPAAASGEVAGYSMKTPSVSSPISTHLSKMLVNSRVNP